MWPVTGQGFQNTKWTAVLYSQYISQIEKIQLNQTIICRLRKVKRSWNALSLSKNSLWFTLGSESETMFCDILAWLPVKVLKTLNDMWNLPRIYKTAGHLVRGTQRRFPPKYTENSFKVTQSTFRPLEMNSISAL